jgi:hypothetical protein
MSTVTEFVAAGLADAPKTCRSGMNLARHSSLRGFVLRNLTIGKKTADKPRMSPLNPLSNNSYLQSILGTALQGTGLSTSNNGTSSPSVDASSLTMPSDNSQLSPVADLMSTLQQLQQSNPAEYQQITQQIATNLKNAAQTAQTQGNTSAASELNQLSSVFTQASQSGQLPSAQDLTQALGGHHHHGHHHAESSSDSSSSSSSTSSASTTSNTSDSSSTNPFEIILSTLSSAGISLSGSSQSA